LGTILFSSSVLIGLGYFFGSLDDDSLLVSRYPETWMSYDIATDAAAAVMSVAGMSFVRPRPRIAARLVVSSMAH
jgi:hypothetical protein